MPSRVVIVTVVMCDRDLYRDRVVYTVVVMWWFPVIPVQFSLCLKKDYKVRLALFVCNLPREHLLQLVLRNELPQIGHKQRGAGRIGRDLWIARMTGVVRRSSRAGQRRTRQIVVM